MSGQPQKESLVTHKVVYTSTRIEFGLAIDKSLDDPIAQLISKAAVNIAITRMEVSCRNANTVYARFCKLTDIILIEPRRPVQKKG